MGFIKKNFWTVILFILLGLVAFVPSVKEFFQRQLLMKPALEKLDSEITVNAVDYNIQLKGINVPDANLADFKNKNLFLNFWGSWCPPCRAEWGSIQKLYDNKKDKISFVLIAMQDEEPAVRKFLTENHYNVPVYFAESPISEKLLPKVFPTTFIISKQGKIMKKEENSSDWNSNSVHQFIDLIAQ